MRIRTTTRITAAATAAALVATAPTEARADGVSVWPSGQERSISGLTQAIAHVPGGWRENQGLVFELYGPDDPSCAREPALRLAPLQPEGEQVSSKWTEIARTGVYQWVVRFTGEAVPEPRPMSACSDPAARLTVRKHHAVIRWLNFGKTPAGSTIQPVFVSMDHAPDQQIIADLYGPGDPSCSGPPIWTTGTSNESGFSGSPTRYQPTALGLYRWRLRIAATELGDAVSTQCNEPGSTELIYYEPTDVSPDLTPELAAQLGIALRGPDLSSGATVTCASSTNTCVGSIKVVGLRRTLATAKFRVNAGRKRTIRLRHTRASRKILTKRRRLRATLIATCSCNGTTPLSVRRQVVLKAKR